MEKHQLLYFQGSAQRDYFIIVFHVLSFVHLLNIKTEKIHALGN